MTESIVYTDYQEFKSRLHQMEHGDIITTEMNAGDLEEFDGIFSFVNKSAWTANDSVDGEYIFKNVVIVSSVQLNLRAELYEIEFYCGPEETTDLEGKEVFGENE